jgi:hypothetical protein
VYRRAWVPHDHALAVSFLRGGLSMRRSPTGGRGEAFQEVKGARERVRRLGGGAWWRESIQVAEEWVKWRRPKWECCQVRMSRG